MNSKNLKADANVPNILKKDGVIRSEFNMANQEITHVPDLIKKYGIDSSWSHTLVNSESNSSTLICQLPGEGNRRHFHPDWNEWWYIVEGTWEWEIEGQKKKVSQGDVVFIEKNRKHIIEILASNHIVLEAN